MQLIRNWETLNVGLRAHTSPPRRYMNWGAELGQGTTRLELQEPLLEKQHTLPGTPHIVSIPPPKAVDPGWVSAVNQSPISQ